MSLQAKNKKVTEARDEAVRSVKAQDTKIATLQRHLASINQVDNAPPPLVVQSAAQVDNALSALRKMTLS